MLTVTAVTTLNPGTRSAFTTQEQPDFTPGFARIGVPPPANFVSPAIRRYVTTSQENPDVPSSAFARSGVAPPANFVPPVTSRISTQQEQPYHPGSLAKPGVAPATFVSPTVSRYIVTVQEQPDLGSGRTFSRPVPNVASLPQVNQYVTTSQEQPWHPLPPKFPQFIVTIAATPVPPSIGRPVTQQEIPFHPGSFALPWPGLFAVVPPSAPVATYYLLEDYWSNAVPGGVMLPAGTLQATFPAGLLPQNWIPGPNVDPVNDLAVAAYTAAGYQTRSLSRQQFSPVPVTPPNYVWVQINNVWVLQKVANFNRVLPLNQD